MEICSLGIDQHRNASLAAQCDHDSDIGQSALAIVGEYYCTSTLQGAAQSADHGVTGHVGDVFFIQPYQLLAAALNTRLGDGRTIRGTREITRDATCTHDGLE